MGNGESAAPASANPGGESSDARQPAVARVPVLVIDDNVLAAETLGELLRLEGFDVRVATSGRKALATLDAFHARVVLLDIGMPDMNGHDVAREIRARGDQLPVTIIAISGWGQPLDKARSLEAGIDHHLTKPVDAAAILSIIGSVV